MTYRHPPAAGYDGEDWPAKMTDTSVRERLARRLYETWDETNVPWNLRAPDDPTRQIFAEGVDAILAELAEPSHATVLAGIGPMKSEDEEQAGRTFCAMIQHIRGGGS